MFFWKDPPQTEGRRDADPLIKTPPESHTIHYTYFFTAEGKRVPRDCRCGELVTVPPGTPECEVWCWCGVCSADSPPSPKVKVEPADQVGAWAPLGEVGSVEINGLQVPLPRGTPVVIDVDAEGGSSAERHGSRGRAGGGRGRGSSSGARGGAGVPKMCRACGVPKKGHVCPRVKDKDK